MPISSFIFNILPPLNERPTTAWADVNHDGLGPDFFVNIMGMGVQATPRINSRKKKERKERKKGKING